MKISIIIPTFNDRGTLPQTLRSVMAQDGLEQSGVTFEVIVVNDCGDSPADLMPDDPRVRLIDLTENVGAYAARNRGLSASEGDILFFLDADDIIAPGLFAYVAARFADPEINLLFMGMDVQEETESGEGVTAPPPIPLEAPLRRLDAAAFCAAFLQAHGPFVPSTTFIRRVPIVAALGSEFWMGSLRNAGDTLFLLSVADRMDMHLSDAVGTTYRIRPKSLSRINPTKTYTARIKAMEVLLDRPEAPPRKPVIRKTAWRLRQNAVRRVARLHAQNGARGEALSVMRQYLWRPFDPKMAAEMARLALGWRP